MGTQMKWLEIKTLKGLAGMPPSKNILVVYGVLEKSLLEKISSDFLGEYPEQTCEFTIIYLLEILNESPEQTKEVRIFLERMVEDPGATIVHCVCFEDVDENAQFPMYLSCICLGMVAFMHVKTLIKLCVFHTEKQASLIKALLLPVKMNLTEFVCISSNKEEVVRSITSLFRFKDEEYRTFVSNELNQLPQKFFEEVPDMSQSGD